MNNQIYRHGYTQINAYLNLDMYIYLSDMICIYLCVYGYPYIWIWIFTGLGLAQLFGRKSHRYATFRFKKKAILSHFQSFGWSKVPCYALSNWRSQCYAYSRYETVTATPPVIAKSCFQLLPVKKKTALRLDNNVSNIKKSLLCLLLKKVTAMSTIAEKVTSTSLLWAKTCMLCPL